jgi:hypothetical protein
MHSKWLDFATEVAAFHYQSKRYDNYKPPSFGANPGVQSLEVRASEILYTNNNSNDDKNHYEGLVLPTTSRSVDDGGNIIGSETETGVPSQSQVRVRAAATGTTTQKKSSPTKHHKHHPSLLTAQGLPRHAKSPTYTDLIEQMNACEAEEAEMKRQSLDMDEPGSEKFGGYEDSDDNQINHDNDDDDDDDIIHRGTASVTSSQIFAKGGGVNENGNDNDNGNDDDDQLVGEGSRRRRSWVRQIKDRQSERKLQRKSRRKEKIRQKASEISGDLHTITTINRNSNNVNESRKQQKKRYKRDEKLKRRRIGYNTANAAANAAANNNNPRRAGNAASQLYNHRKSITRPQGSHQQEIQFRDRFDVKTGKPYSTFTAVSRKHLRDGNLDPDIIPPLLFLEECAHLLSLMSAVAFSTLRNDLPEAESPLTVFEPGLPWPLIDPDGYRGRVRKGWTQSKSKIYSALQFALGRSRNDRARTLYNAARPFRVIGNVSDMEIEKLQEARGPLAKVSLVSMWLLELISREYQAGSTGAVAPPIVSRLYQFVSEGLAGYNQARKIAYIPFPFPHAQITTVFMLVVDFFVCPLLMTTYVYHFSIGLLLNFISVLCFTGLHEVAREIENPFQNVPNDVPLNNYQAQFNEGLMIMFYGYHPDAYWDNNQHSNNDGVGYNNNNNNQTSNETSQNETHTTIGKKDVAAMGDLGNIKTKEQGKEEKTIEKKMENVGLDFTTSLNDTNMVSFSFPNNNRVNNKEATPESMPVKFLRVPDGESIREVASMAETATTRSEDEGVVPGSSSTNSSSNSLTTDVNKKKIFRVPMGNRMGPEPSSSGSFRITDNSSNSFRIVPPTYNSSNNGSESDPSSGVQFRVPNTQSIGSSAEFQVPNSEFDSSAIFQTNKSSKDD